MLRICAGEVPLRMNRHVPLHFLRGGSGLVDLINYLNAVRLMPAQSTLNGLAWWDGPVEDAGAFHRLTEEMEDWWGLMSFQ
jgi:hypothetical protein